MLLLTTALLGLCAVPVQGPSFKDQLDQELAFFRASQAEDGSYGDPIDTVNVLVAMALSPRSYREDDGPFIKLAVKSLITELSSQSEPATDSAAAFALNCLDGERYQELISTLKHRSSNELFISYSEPSDTQSASEIMQSIEAHFGLKLRAEICARAAIIWTNSKRQQLRPTSQLLESSYKNGCEYLLKARGESGMWEMFGKPEPGISALCARALLASPNSDIQSAAVPTLDYLISLQNEDGSIHAGHLPVYVTSVAIMALTEAQRPADREAIARAANFLRIVQADSGEGYSEGDRYYGGIGYGGDLRPDLSNLQYALQALKSSGAKADDPALKRALVFLERSQNRSESNTATYKKIGSDEKVKAGNDGGATYMPGDSPAGYTTAPDGSLVARSYGSMTYALLKCYVFAGLKPADPRLAAATDWVAKHWTLEVNPGFDSLRDPRAGFQGLYYYYLSLAEALAVSGIDNLTGADRKPHNWRQELVNKLAELQNQDGSWVNQQAERWWEGNPVLCSAYALCALDAARK